MAESFPFSGSFQLGASSLVAGYPTHRVAKEFTLKPISIIHCPGCYTQKVARRITRDKIDPVIKSFSSIVQGLLGGTLYHCYYCRIQFYDLRHTMKSTANPNEPTR